MKEIKLNPEKSGLQAVPMKVVESIALFIEKNQIEVCILEASETGEKLRYKAVFSVVEGLLAFSDVIHLKEAETTVEDGIKPSGLGFFFEREFGTAFSAKHKKHSVKEWQACNG